MEYLPLSLFCGAAISLASAALLLLLIAVPLRQKVTRSEGFIFGGLR